MATASRELATRLGLPLISAPPQSGLWLQWTTAGLALQAGAKRPQRLIVDFAAGAQGHRAAQLGHRRELVARACGVGGGRDGSIVDATAGLGRDGFVLAALGARVTMLERSPILGELLADGLQRARQAGHAEIVERISLITTEAADWLTLQSAETPPRVVYLDPMYAETRRRAAAGKALAMLQKLLEPDDDANGLLDVARTVATERVVVKRHRKAPPLGAKAPDYTLTGRSTRFDVYRVSAAPPVGNEES